MKKTVLLITSLSISLMAVELEYGTGTFSMKGGFVGLTGSISTDIDAYSLVDRHSNMASNLYYGYDLHLYDSELMKQAQHSYNNMASTFNTFSPIDVPKMEHRIKGMDANLHLGYDLIHQDQDNFLGLGLTAGISMPTIDSVSMNKKAFSLTKKLLKKTKTEVETYKIGPSITMQKSLNRYLSVYGTGSYAYQTGEVKNSYLNSTFDVDGTFQTYNFGLYFTPFTDEYKWGWITFSPRIFATLGYRYEKWEVGEMAINASGMEISSSMLEPLGMNFSMESSVGYFGVGVSF
jgi:hypothetical protein